ncbi:MAG: ATP-dependent RNA helicase HrpA [Proteobacteria bacterium]|nr:ATP-dependent RNA helicase HrpA [Pseudomonadota bacterium]
MGKPSVSIQKIEASLNHVFRPDRHVLFRALNQLKKKAPAAASDEAFQGALETLFQRVRESIKRKNHRRQIIPKGLAIPDLPISHRKKDIIETIKKHQVTIIAGETGSGKTTQIPKFCLEAGRGVNGYIGCTQPRRIAAITVSARIAEELETDMGTLVGYKIRFQDQTREDSIIKIMTDGILLAEAQKDRFLNQYDTIIVDEAHERSLNIDFILGILHTLLKKRKDLKLIITSATIDTEKFSKAFDDAPIIEVSGRMFPVDVKYLTQEDISPDGEEKTYVELAVRACEKIIQETYSGDILMFMPTEQDIRETIELIEGRGYPGVFLLPLYARLPSSDQKKVFSSGVGRKVVVATNVAETSITIPGIKYVIDTGLARISEYAPGTGTTSLPIKNISRSSADQRKGRCGRVENGICVRLFEEGDFESRPLYTPPEILRSNLAEVILKMIDLHLGDIANFPFIDTPSHQSIRDGFNTLRELGAIADEKKPARAGKPSGPCLTKTGKIMAGLPLDPRISRMLIEARKENCLKEMIVIASALSISDPKERPPEKEQQADQQHQTFVDPYSDFITLLNIWKKFHEFNGTKRNLGKINKFCKTYFLSFRRMRELLDIHEQISKILEEYDLESIPEKEWADPSKTDEFSPLYTGIHKSVLSGYLSNIAFQKEKNFFQATRGREVMIFPGSGLFNRPKSWIVAAEMVKTSRLFARTVANIDNAWLEEIGKAQCTYTYDSPHWERKRGEVMANETVSLFSLTIISGRGVSYGTIDPEEASEIFIRSALIDGDITMHPRDKTFSFLQHNRDLIGQVLNMENKLRKRDILVNEDDLLLFYRERLKGITGIVSLKQFLKTHPDQTFLHLTIEDILKYRPEENELSLFPDRIRLGEHEFECLYAFEPGKETDGITVKIPSSTAASVPKEKMDWIIPGLLKEKIENLIKGLPKEYRRRLVPISRHAEIIAAEMPQTDTPLVNELSQFIHKRFGINIPGDIWSTDSIPDHLKMRIAITGKKGEELFAGRDISILSNTYSPSHSEKELNDAKKKWERTDITTWNFGDLPETIPLGKPPYTWHVFPALAKENGSIAIRLFTDRNEAEAAHKEGVAALFVHYFSKETKDLKKDICLPSNLDKKTSAFGGKKPFEQSIADGVIRHLFYKPLRSFEDFMTHAEKNASLIYRTGQIFKDKALSILKAHDEAMVSIDAMTRSSLSNSSVQQFLQTIRADLAALVPSNVMVLYEMDRLSHLERYVKAIGIRAERGFDNPAKDLLKSKEVEGFKASLHVLIHLLSEKNVSPEKRKAIENLYWMIEEYKVSIYAQELKTPIKISAKILSKEIERIERMI